MTDAGIDVSPEVARLVADAADAFQARRARGEDPDPEEYAARHPDAADAIRRVLSVLRWAPVTRSSPADDPPRMLGDYRIVREVGRGGMGVVYEAEQLSLHRRVALKVLPFAALADPRLLQRFYNEARAAAALDHPHVVKVYGVGQERGVHFIAMQFIDGRPLSDLIGAVHGRASPEATVTGMGVVTPDTVPAAQLSTLPDVRTSAFARRVAELGIQSAQALEHAHALGVVHRDVKPGNLLIDAAGGVWVSDFGLAKVASADVGVTLTGDVFGTLRYMSPEQALAKHDLVDHRTDVYALGATLYELLTGDPAVGGKDKAEVLRRITDGEPAPVRKSNRDVPADLETVVLKCLRKEPNDRYASAKELADDLRRFVRGEPVRARPISRVSRTWRRVVQRPWVVGLSAAVLVATSAAVGFGLWAAYREQVIETAKKDNELKQQALDQTRKDEDRDRFFFGLERVRQRRSDPYPGWSQENMADLRGLARMEPAGEALHDLRSEAAAGLSALDLVQAGVVGPGFPACGLDYSPDGRWLAAGRWGGLSIRLYDGVTGQHVRDLSIAPDDHSRLWAARDGMSDRVLSLRFSPDSRWLVAGTASGQVACWDANNFRSDPGVRAEPRVWAAHTEAAETRENKVFTVVFAADGQTFLSGARTSIRRWFPDGRPAGPGIDGFWLPYSLPPVGGRTPVVRERQGELQVLDLDTGQVVPGTRQPGTYPFAVAPGGRLMAFAPIGWGVIPPRLQAIQPGAAARPLNTGAGAPVHLKNLEYMAFDPAGDLLVTVEEHVRRVKLWDVAAGQLVAAERTGGDAVRAAFTPDGRRLAVAGRHGVALFDLPNRVLDTLAPVGEDHIAAVAATRDHSTLWVTGAEPGLPVRVFRWEAGASAPGLREVAAFPAPAGAGSSADCSPDGRTAVYTYAEGGLDHLRTTGGTVWTARDVSDVAFAVDGRLWFTAAHELRVAGPPDWADRVVWKNNPSAVDEGMGLRAVAVGHTWVFVGRRDGRVVRIDTQTGEATRWALSNTPIDRLALSPDETRLVVGGDGGEVRLVDPATGEAREIPDAHRGAVPAAAFGRHFFVTGSADRRVRLWSPDGRPLATLRMQGPVRKVLLSDDERSLLVLVEGERAVRRWRLDVLFQEWRALGLGDDLPPI